MCRHCGHFVVAVERDGALVPLRDECPECGGTEFKDVHRGTVVRSDDR
jgi:predicted  nucleic acid-binding Zn-ribbon protein